MATKKKAVKKAAPAKKATKQPVKKAPAPPAKKANKVVPKKSAPKPAAKKPAVKKPVAKTPVKPVAKPVSKPVAKPVVAKHVAKPVVKPVAKAPVKVAAKPVAPVEVKKPENKPAVTIIDNKPKPKGLKEIKQELKKIEQKKVREDAKREPIVIPKVSAKTSVKYQPDFTKSILDTPPTQETGPIVRYGDIELGEFRDIINRKLEAAKRELTYLQGLITRKDEMGGDSDDGHYMTMEDGSMSMEREQLSQMASRQITYIDHLEKATMRIENKTYGICRITGKLIDKARLKAVPHATLSIEAKMMQK
jgi:RNA polymerase-binding transcription factor DksA